eukprot:CAMPEP_0182857412 /NCGR_PEP_ID=MMETSP0034_2-20130328/3036_1 /TAXON_ID=156128 /ORGANISM="Nephroselmis pyriformis, Strain CCMP717" /LENGTH=64 /DNA_ID=CAMNT_0024988651 /DNA_START=44 /DNA_END=238 /DNA_ORIENTATION=+
MRRGVEVPIFVTPGSPDVQEVPMFVTPGSPDVQEVPIFVTPGSPDLCHSRKSTGQQPKPRASAL